MGVTWRVTCWIVWAAAHKIRQQMEDVLEVCQDRAIPSGRSSVLITLANKRLTVIAVSRFAGSKQYQYQPVLRCSIMRRSIGVRISSMARPILPPGTTMVLRRLIHEPWIIWSR